MAAASLSRIHFRCFLPLSSSLLSESCFLRFFSFLCFLSSVRVRLRVEVGEGAGKVWLPLGNGPYFLDI